MFGGTVRSLCLGPLGWRRLLPPPLAPFCVLWLEVEGEQYNLMLNPKQPKEGEKSPTQMTSSQILPSLSVQGCLIPAVGCKPLYSIGQQKNCSQDFGMG